MPIKLQKVSVNAEKIVQNIKAKFVYTNIHKKEQKL